MGDVAWTARRHQRIPSTRAWGLALAFVTACISGVSVFVNAHYVGQVDDATVYTTAKNGFAALLLLALLVGIRGAAANSQQARLSRWQWLGLAGLGLVGGSIPFILFFEGLARAGSATSAGFIHKTLVVWVAFLAIPLLHERLTAFHITAIGLLLFGQALLTDDLATLGIGTGEVMIFGATILWAIEFVIAKRLLGSMGSPAVGAARLGLGLVFLVAYVFVTGRADGFGDLTAEQWGWVVVTGALLAGFVATWYGALARAQAIDVTAILVFGQVVTTLLTAAAEEATVLPDLTALSLITVGVAAIIIGTLRGRRPVINA